LPSNWKATDLPGQEHGMVGKKKEQSAEDRADARRLFDFRPGSA
jgi:hypothetical protein